MRTQDIVRKLMDEAGYGNIAIWADDPITVIPADSDDAPAGKKPLVDLKPVALVNRFELPAYALYEILLAKIKTTVRAAGGHSTRGPRL